MKVKLLANVSANGQIPLAGNTKSPTSPEAFGFIVKSAIQAGNIIIGRKTLDVLQNFPGGIKTIFPETEIVVLSKTATKTDDYMVVNSPEEALAYLKEKGFKEIVVAGGAQVYNLFLDKDLVTDVYFNYLPMIMGDGGAIGANKDLHLNFKLAEQSMLTHNIVQVHLERV